MSPDSPNCPFYGATVLVGEDPDRTGQVVFWRIGGNRCAAKIGRNSPCEMELDGKPVDWRLCPVIGSV